MSGRYYEVAVLRPGRTAAVDAVGLTVDLDGVSQDELVCNDGDLLEKKTQGRLLYVSGGGSVVVGAHYLLVVEREARARIHPGKFSLFTGRSDNLGERENPGLLVRELFEELVLYRNGKLVWPMNMQHQPLIDRVYAGMGLEQTDATAVEFNDLPLATSPLLVTSGGTTRRLDVSWHIGSKGEINVLKLFKADIPIDELSARDGEGLGRKIWAYDMETSNAFPISDSGGGASPRKLSPADMTEHLVHVLSGIVREGTVAARTS